MAELFEGDYDSLPLRIRDIFDTCSAEEQSYLIDILHELSDTGSSPTYDNLFLQDYKEIPVDIDTFLCSEEYLGIANDGGDSIFPYWKDGFHEIFDDTLKYTQIIFTGATRIGKSSTAVTGVAYMLYRLMCFRNPQKFFKKKEISKFYFLFFNITLDLARTIGFREFNDLLKSSPWFNRHGTFSGSKKNFYYIPEGGLIEIVPGSNFSHALGMQVYCLVGDTRIRTSSGYVTLKELCNRRSVVYSTDGRQLFQCDNILIFKTKRVSRTVRIQLSDGSIVEGTPNHKLLVNFDDLNYVALEKITCGTSLSCFLSSGSLSSIEVERVEYINYESGIDVYDVLDVGSYHNFLIGCNSCDIVSHNCCFIDEMNFAKAGIKDINKAKKNVKESYDAIMARIEGTFRLDGVVWGKLFAVSSKKTDQDFLEDHISKQKAAGNDHLLVFDAPQWEILPEGTFSKERFWLAVGDKHRKGFVVQDESDEALAELRDQGYSLMQVPLDMKTNFLADFDVALRDLAGISVPGSMSFISQEAIDKCIGNRRNPFYQDVLEIGTKDAYAIEDFFHWEFLTPEILHADWFIHLDLSLNDDKTGIGGSCITGRKEIIGDNKKAVSLPYFSHIFNISIKSPVGDKIPYAKITNFICWLRKQGAHIEKITRDQYQSEYIAQLLEGEGFDVEKVSLDRTPDGYVTLRSVLLEERVDMLHIELLENELIQLQRDGFSGIPDHPVGGCFIGNTKIRLSNSSVMTIENIVNTLKDNKYYVFTVNELTQDIEVKRILSGRITKYVKSTVAVMLSNFRAFECTPDHRIMLDNGEYIQADHLREGQSLKYVDNEVKVLYKSHVEYSEPIPVYDIAVEDNPNFSLDCGVFVHNSKDSADGFAGSIWAASKYSPGVPVDRTNVAASIVAANKPRNSAYSKRMPGIVNPYSRYRKV